MNEKEVVKVIVPLFLAGISPLLAYYNGMENKLKFYREKLNMNQTEMAQFLHIRRDLYNKYENNTKPIGITQAGRIWQRLKTEFPDMNLQDLFLWE